MIKDANCKSDDYSIPSKIKQILLDWGYELVGSDLLQFFSLTTLCSTKMSKKTLKLDYTEVNKKNSISLHN